jgi:hypothetical protein
MATANIFHQVSFYLIGSKERNNVPMCVEGRIANCSLSVKQLTIFLFFDLPKSDSTKTATK